VPTVSTVSPNVWTAGQSYPVTITGTNFVTAAKATTACPVSTVYVQTPTTSPDVTVAVSGISVVSATEITATVEATSAPYTGPPLKGGTPAPAGAIAATVEVIATPPAQSGPAPAVAAKVVALDATTAAAPNVDVLLPPQIVCAGSWMQCNGETISGGAAAATAVVGQTITLSTTPSATTLADLPVLLYLTADTWTAPGTIGGDLFGPLAANGSPTSASTTPTVLTDSGLTAYWLYPNPSVPVTYSYCASTSILDIADEQCSATATATFDVVGPTATITPVLSLDGSPVYATGHWSVTAGYTGCPDNSPGLTQLMVFGQYNAPTATCTQSVSIPGIVFAATNINAGNVTAPNADFLWAQLITGGQTSGTGTGATTTPVGTGLDNLYPAAVAAASSAYVGTEDSPGEELVNSWSTETRTFTAQMYLLWNSHLDPAAIAVPIGYLTWSINGTANNNTASTPPWSLSLSTTLHSATTTYTPSTDTGAPSHGLPVWTSISYNSLSTTDESESVPADGEEENKQWENMGRISLYFCLPYKRLPCIPRRPKSRLLSSFSLFWRIMT
jgi:hypothetical protein